MPSTPASPLTVVPEAPQPVGAITEALPTKEYLIAVPPSAA